MNMKQLFILFFIMAIAVMAGFKSAEATVINVPQDYPTIQEGILQSSAGDTVLVAEGHYYERINFSGRDILLTSEFLIDNDTTHIHNTIIDADTSILGYADNGSVVIFDSEEDTTSILQGFTIQNGIGISFHPYSRGGGGIACVINVNPKIQHNIISNNSANTGGGLFIQYNSNPIIDNNIITENEGHGIYLYDSNPHITNNRISLNTGEYGSGIFANYGSDAFICGNIILDNHGALWGGGIYCQDSDPEIINNKIFGNEAYDWGGGICCDDAEPMIINNVISGNIAHSSGGGIYCLNQAAPTIVNTIVWANSSPDVSFRSGGDPDISYSTISRGWEGEGNIDIDPLFSAAYEFDFNVCSQSPCIDAGDPALTDPDGSRSDIGLYFPDHPECDIGKSLYISTYGNDTTGNGTPQNPYKTIQHGIDVSYSSDTVIVETGTYAENIYVNAKNILLTSNYLYSGDTLDIRNTIIDGGGDSMVVVSAACDSTAAVAGFTIRNGFGWFGGGIFSLYSDITIRDNIIEENTADATGGGICSHHGKPSIINNYIRNNTAESGGGIRIYYSSGIEISRNIISGNFAYIGGGIYASNLGQNSIISNNVFSGNTASNEGGGLEMFGQSCPVINNTFSRNQALTGGAIYCHHADVEITNTIFWADSVSEEHPEIYVDDNSSAILTYCDIQGGWEGEGNLPDDPLFRDSQNNDYHLMATEYGYPENSPGIDAGHPDILDGILDSLWGLGTSLSDIGAYGGGDSVQVGIINRGPAIPGRFALLQNFPNPFNAVTTINFAIPQAQHVTLKIYDILGREVATLLDDYLQAGNHAVNWRAEDESSGVYFYKIQTSEYSDIKKAILLK